MTNCDERVTIGFNNYVTTVGKGSFSAVMFRKFRYAAVLLAAVLVITGTLAATAPGRKVSEKTTEYGSDPLFSVSDLNGALQGNPQMESSKEEAVFSLGTMENLTVAPKTSFEASLSAPSVQEETEEPETLPAPEPSEEITEAPSPEEPSEIPVPETEEEEPAGLRQFFSDKLVIDFSKVELYLNVREEADEDSKILSVLYPNDIMTVVGESGDFYEISCDGYTGFVHRDYVLRGDDAYEALRDTVAYAVMTKQDEIYLYAEPDDRGEKILAAAKGEAFRVIGETGAYYEVSVISPIYKSLFVPKMNVVLYYLFLGPGNDNELPDETEEYLGSLNISSNLSKASKIREEAIEEQSSYEAEIRSYQESVEEERRRWEQESREAEERAAWESAQATETSAWTWTPEPTTWAPEPTTAPSTPAPESSPEQPAPETQGERYRSIGYFRVTAYCHCQLCCGVWGSNDPNYQAHGSSGMPLVDNYSVAVNPAQIPYGTRLLINGREYIAADSGVGSNCIDIYRQTHEAALSMAMYYAEVFVIE